MPYDPRVFRDDLQLGSVIPKEVYDKPLKIGRGLIKPIMYVPDDSQEVKDAYARGERPDLFDALVHCAHGVLMPDQTKHRRGENGAIIHCDEFGRPYGQACAESNPSSESSTMTATIQETDPRTPEESAVAEAAYQQAQKDLLAQRQADAIKYEDLIKAEGGNPVAVAFDILKRALKADAGYAWSWHCNVAMPMYDSMAEATPQRHAVSNRAAGHVMKHVFDVDTLTTFENDLKERTS